MTATDAAQGPNFFASYPFFRKHRDNPAIILMRRAAAYRPVFSGRGTRTELFVTIGQIAAINLGLVIVGAAYPAFGEFLLAPDPAGIIGTIWLTILLLLPILSATIRRLHDTGRYWWALATGIAPWIGWVLLLGILLWDGDEGENAFGRNPRYDLP